VIDHHVTMSCGGGNSSHTEGEGSEIIIASRRIYVVSK